LRGCNFIPRRRQESDTDDTGSDVDEEDEDGEENPFLDLGLTEEPPPAPESRKDSRTPSVPPLPGFIVFLITTLPIAHAPTVPAKIKPVSPAELRRNGLKFSLKNIPRSYNIEAICAIPQPVPTHALAASACLTHLLTGSDDGYIRDYDIYPSVNSKTFLSAPQRQHASVVEGLMKAGQLRYWWENPSTSIPQPGILTIEEEPTLAPVYSLAMHSDALWALAGTDVSLLRNT
jgi:transcriptional activator SPT8